jgi:hypothetical protein
VCVCVCGVCVVCVCVCSSKPLLPRGIASFTFNTATFYHTVCVSNNTGNKLIISLYRISRLVYVIEANRVFCEVGSECLEVAVRK